MDGDTRRRGAYGDVDALGECRQGSGRGGRGGQGPRAVLAELCGQDDGRLFALLDGARVPNLSLMLRELDVPTLGLSHIAEEDNTLFRRKASVGT